jgi:hypothetical protein
MNDTPDPKSVRDDGNVRAVDGRDLRAALDELEQLRADSETRGVR